MQCEKKIPLVSTTVFLEERARILFWGVWTDQPVCAFSFVKTVVKSHTCRAEICDLTHCLITLSEE